MKLIQNKNIRGILAAIITIITLAMSIEVEQVTIPNAQPTANTTGVK